MKKLLLISLAILFLAGIAEATGIPVAVDPKNYPVVWTEDVYNGSGDDIATGQIVRWDFDASDSDLSSVYDDMCPWVEENDELDNVWIAGVTLITKGITNGDTGQIIIKGPAVVDDGAGSSVLTAGQICGAAVDGTVADVSQAGADDGYLGVCIKATAVQQGYSYDPLIYVNPTLSYDD